MSNGITYQDILDCKKWIESYKSYKPYQSELNFEEAGRVEIYFALDKKLLYKTIRESNKIFYVYNSIFKAMKKDGFDCLEKLEIVNKRIPRNLFIDLEED